MISLYTYYINNMPWQPACILYCQYHSSCCTSLVASPSQQNLKAYLVVMCMDSTSPESIHNVLNAERIGSQFLNSSNLTADKPTFRSNLAKGLLGAVCTLITLVLVLILVCALRAYKGLLQRLILYFALATLIYDMLTTSLLEHQIANQKEGQDKLCAVLYFLLNYVANVMVIFAAIIINYLLYLVLKSSKSSSFMVVSRRKQVIAECCCVCMSFVLPSTYMWQQLTDNDLYVISGTYCEINTTVTVQDSTAIKYRNIIINFTITEFIVLEMFVVAVVTLIAYCRIRKHLPHGKKINILVQKTYLLLILYAASCMVNSILLVVITLEKKFFVRLADALWLPSFFEFSLIILFMVSARISERCLPQRRIDLNENDHHVTENSGNFKTNPTSHPFVQPSKTHFSVPYTGGFTEITVASLESADQSSEGASERSPLMKP